VRREYQARRDVLAAALRRRLPGLDFTVPAGGIGLWVHATGGVDVDRWAARARARGAIIATARTLAVDGRRRPYARLGFAYLDRGELEEGVRRLAAAWPG
jgi:DNA-binding transcriptional MocR family regulator